MNRVAHTDTIFNNENLETKPRRKGGRPRKQPITQLINGFPSHIAETSYFNVPAVFVDVVATIDNLAELKVVMYVLRHTWGFHEFKKPVRITTDEFMYGRKKADGKRMDNGTGLSKSAVLDGLERAKKHGFVECLVDDRDKARVKCYYRLKVQNDDSSEPEPPTRHFEKEDSYLDQGNDSLTEELAQQEPVSSEQEQEYPEDYDPTFDPYSGTIFSPNYQPQEQKIFAPEQEPITTSLVVDYDSTGRVNAQRSNKRNNITNSLTKEIRMTPTSLNLEEAIRFLPTPDQLPKPKAKSPAFIRNIMTDFSRDLGDHDHIPSNIGQTARLYHNSGVTEEDFIQALYDAREAAKKATQIKHLNSHGNPNRMPYFFKVLTRALNPQEAV